MTKMPGHSSPAANLPSANLVGRFLVAAPSMPDERFQKSVVFICKHDDEGALGIIVNNKVDDLPLGQVYKQLGIASVDGLRSALDDGRIENSFGARMAQHVRYGVAEIETILLYHAHKLCGGIQKFLTQRAGADRANGPILTDDAIQRVGPLSSDHARPALPGQVVRYLQALIAHQEAEK